MSTTDRDRESVERARAVLPPGASVRGEHRVGLAGRVPKPGHFRRPRVLRSEGRTLWSWCMLPVRAAATVVSVTWNPFEAFFEAVFWRDEKKKPGKPFHGGWNSMAGELARALSPRSRNGAHVVMQVGDRHLQLAYVSCAGSLTGRHGPVEAGWATDLQHVTWIRDRRDVVGGRHEVAFTDGSWCSVQFMGQGWRRMAEAFPVRLSYRDQIPSQGWPAR
ncbi:hypothetical protein ACFQVC_02715 [Streptomyces monticola]|uniref:Uncharacterized protein n=1 Tax=Streptomyces monticola TaxID=2666263 RepID=A0ABW2JBD6_9ACTN